MTGLEPVAWPWKLFPFLQIRLLVEHAQVVGGVASTTRKWHPMIEVLSLRVKGFPFEVPSDDAAPYGCRNVAASFADRDEENQGDATSSQQGLVVGPMLRLVEECVTEPRANQRNSDSCSFPGDALPSPQDRQHDAKQGAKNDHANESNPYQFVRNQASTSKTPNSITHCCPHCGAEGLAPLIYPVGKHIDIRTGIFPISEWGSSCYRGFVSNSRFDPSATVIPRTNRQTTKKWRTSSSTTTGGNTK